MIKNNVSLKPFNTFGIEVVAKAYLEINNLEDVFSLESIIPKYQKFMILGEGSNVLFLNNFDGLIIHNKLLGKRIIEENKDYAIVCASSGEIWHQLVLFCLDKNLAGLENLSLIPGTVGAAPMQNIGAYGVETKDTFYKLEAYNFQTAKIDTFHNEDCKFGYRESIFKNEFQNKYFITKVCFKLSKTHNLNTSYGAINDELQKNNITNPTLKDVSNAVIAIRQSKLPNPAELGNAGSFFKNPEINVELFNELKTEYPDIPGYQVQNSNNIKVPAGWLIEKCGLKGKVFGNTGSHKNQALVIVNYGNATGSEIYEHALRVQELVSQKFKINLQTEVNIIK